MTKSDQKNVKVSLHKMVNQKNKSKMKHMTTSNQQAQGDQEADQGKPSYEGQNKIKEEVHGNRKLDDESVLVKQKGNQGADQCKPSIATLCNEERIFLKEKPAIS